MLASDRQNLAEVNARQCPSWLTQQSQEVEPLEFET